MSDPSVVVVVQARMGSSRLPGKVAMPFGPRPMLGFQLARLAPLGAQLADRGIGLRALVVATSDLDRDDPVADIARDAGVEVHRGSEADVLDRVASVLDHHRADHLVRLTADCPWTDPELVALIAAAHVDGGADYTSNTLLRTWPDGLDVEAITADALMDARQAAAQGPEREHVTPHFQRHPDRFALAQVVQASPLGDLRWTVDTADDLAVLAEPAVQPEAASASWQDLRTLLPGGPHREGDLVLHPVTPASATSDLPPAAREVLAAEASAWVDGVRAVDGTDDVWHGSIASAPGRVVRPWTVERVGPDGATRPIGVLVVTVREGGTAAAAGSWPADEHAAVTRLLVTALAADAQTVALPELPAPLQQNGTR
ncbi:MAG: spore coat protein [Acidimicrobiales bacterium]|nr:spore coat protein [Acidimicrobiales bacterium]